MRFAVTKLSTLAHKLNTEFTSFKFEVGCPDDEINEHLQTSQNIISLVESIYGYMQDDLETIKKQQTQLFAATAEHNDDLREATESVNRYKKRIKLLTNKLKRVSELQTKK
jgi:septation ring formation regulator EzrA